MLSRRSFFPLNAPLPSFTSLTGLKSNCFALASHPHLPLLATGSVDAVVRVWDLETRTCLFHLAEHVMFIYGLAFDPAGRRLASASGDRTICVWDLDTSVCLCTLRGHESAVFSVAWDASGTWIASAASDRTVRLWEAASGTPRAALRNHTNSVNVIASHPSDDLFASGSADRSIRIWQWSTGECVRTLLGHTGPVYSLLATSAFLVSRTALPGIRVWSWTSEACIHVLDDSGFPASGLSSMSWCAGSTLVALEKEGTVRVWDTTAPNPEHWFCEGSLPEKAVDHCAVAAWDGGRVVCTMPSDVPGDERTMWVWGE